MPLNVTVTDELHWGAPALTQLRRVLDRHALSGSKRRGVHRDRTARRVDAQSTRFAADVARRVERHDLRPVVLVGPRPMIDAVFGALSTTSRSRVTLLPATLSPRTPAELRTSVAPVVKRWRRDAQRKAA